jgi:hypothetical protein
MEQLGLSWEPERRILTVGQLTGIVREMLGFGDRLRNPVTAHWGFGDGVSVTGSKNSSRL